MSNYPWCSVCMCTFTCIHSFIHVTVCVCAHIRFIVLPCYICMYIFLYMFTLFTFAYIHMQIYIYIHTHTYVYTYKHTHTHMHACLHAYMHAYIMRAYGICIRLRFCPCHTPSIEGWGWLLFPDLENSSNNDPPPHSSGCSALSPPPPLLWLL